MYAINLIPHDHAGWTVHVVSTPRVGELVSLPRGEYRVISVRHVAVEDLGTIRLATNVHLTAA